MKQATETRGEGQRAFSTWEQPLPGEKTREAFLPFCGDYCLMEKRRVAVPLIGKVVKFYGKSSQHFFLTFLFFLIPEFQAL